MNAQSEKHQEQAPIDESHHSEQWMLRDDLRTVYQATMISRVDFRTRIWETIKTAALLSTGTLAGVGGIAASNVTPKEYFAILGVLLIVIGIYLGFWTYYNVRREQALQYHDEFTLYQIEKLLGLHERIPEKFRWKPNAPSIFNRKHLSSTYRSKLVKRVGADPVEEWVQGRLANQLFLKEIIFGFAGILFLPMFGIGSVLLILGVQALFP